MAPNCYNTIGCHRNLLNILPIGDLCYVGSLCAYVLSFYAGKLQCVHRAPIDLILCRYNCTFHRFRHTNINETGNTKLQRCLYFTTCTAFTIFLPMHNNFICTFDSTNHKSKASFYSTCNFQTSLVCRQ
jgi:hypothetical protein